MVIFDNFIAAEIEEFEPPIPFGIPVFHTSVIDHYTKFPLKSGAYGTQTRGLYRDRVAS